MIGLFYDTETTGLPLWHEPSEDPRQPHLVQLAAVMVDLDTREELAAIDAIILPDGWEIPEEVSAIHGITTEYALTVGVPERDVLDMLVDAWQNAGSRIAHNESFDARIVRIGLKRYFPQDEPIHDAWKAGRTECTQKLATPILKLPPTARMRAYGRHHYKSANLGEAYQHFTGKPLENAHSAMADVRACMAVYFAIRGAPVEAA